MRNRGSADVRVFLDHEVVYTERDIDLHHYWDQHKFGPNRKNHNIFCFLRRLNVQLKYVHAGHLCLCVQKTHWGVLDQEIVPRTEAHIGAERLYLGKGQSSVLCCLSIWSHVYGAALCLVFGLLMSLSRNLRMDLKKVKEWEQNIDCINIIFTVNPFNTNSKLFIIGFLHTFSTGPHNTVPRYSLTSGFTD